MRTLDELFAREPELAGVLAHPRVGRYRAVRSPMRWGGEKAPLGSAPPTLGQHTDAVLRELGYREEEIRGMRERGEVRG